MESWLNVTQGKVNLAIPRAHDKKYKILWLIGWLFIGCFILHEKSLLTWYQWMGLLTNIKPCFENETALKFADFCHCCLAIMSVHMYAYHYPLFESEMKTGWWTIRKYIALAVGWTQRIAVNYIDYSYNDAMVIIAYGDINYVVFNNWFTTIFVVAIITSYLCFAGIILWHCIVLYYIASYLLY